MLCGEWIKLDRQCWGHSHGQQTPVEGGFGTRCYHTQGELRIGLENVLVNYVSLYIRIHTCVHTCARELPTTADKGPSALASFCLI